MINRYKTYHFQKCISHLLQCIPGIKSTSQTVEKSFMKLQNGGNVTENVVNGLGVNDASIFRWF